MFRIILLFIASTTSLQSLEWLENDAHIQKLLLDEVNLQRSLVGVKPLVWWKTLEQVATEHNQNMVEHKFFSHTSPLPGGENLESRLAKWGITQGWMGENLAKISALIVEKGVFVFPPSVTGGGFRHQIEGADLEPHSPASAVHALVEQLMASPTHRANLLHPGFRSMGAKIIVFENLDAYGLPYLLLTQIFSSSTGGAQRE